MGQNPLDYILAPLDLLLLLRDVPLQSPAGRDQSDMLARLVDLPFDKALFFQSLEVEVHSGTLQARQLRNKCRRGVPLGKAGEIDLNLFLFKPKLAQFFFHKTSTVIDIQSTSKTIIFQA